MIANLTTGRSARWLAAALHLTFTPIFAADDDVMRAMRDELARSMRKLQLENLDKPYFVAYRVVEMRYCGVAASFGALTQSGSCDVPGQPRNRGLSVEVRVGDYSSGLQRTAHTKQLSIHMRRRRLHWNIAHVRKMSPISAMKRSSRMTKPSRTPAGIKRTWKVR